MLASKSLVCVRATPNTHSYGSKGSAFSGTVNSFQRLHIRCPSESRVGAVQVEASRVCDLTGKKANNGYVVTFSHKRNKKLQQPNLQYKKVYWPEGQRWVKLRICTKAMKTIEKKGLQAMAKEAGIDLNKLPFEDARPQRKEWLAQNESKPPMSKKGRKMKNSEKLAASKKTPLTATYVSGKIAYVRSSSAN
eukprot:jgi/Picsp_1/5187/NSC_02550-R1_50s ribosomal protein l28